jgi:superfamily II DNA or RNA helicase
MEIVDNSVLLLRTRQPEKYGIIPKSRDMGHVGNGVHEVAVRWGIDEARVLKNLGVKDVPSPILRNYNWPGRFTPFMHQKQVASFLTLHRRAFNFGEAGCVDSETEYLTSTGWRRIDCYEGGLVAQYLPEEGRIEFVQPTEYVKKPCADMVRIKTKYGLDQLLSPEHRVLIRSNGRAEKMHVTSAESLLQQHAAWHAGVRTPYKGRTSVEGVAFGHAAIPTVYSAPEREGLALTDAQLRVQVAVMADGHFPDKSGACVVRLKRDRKIARMEALLAAAAIPYKVRAQNTATAQGFRVYSFQAPWRIKEYDERFWSASISQRLLIAEEVVHWDGCARNGAKGVSFSTTSKLSADFIQYVWCSLGRTTRILEDARDKYRAGVCYTVQARIRQDAWGLVSPCARKRATMWREPSTDGFKYCFSVPSTFLLFRRNGCVFASGNTGKTLSTLWAADYLMQQKQVRRCLIVCPLSIMHSAWVRDLNHSIIHRSAIIAHHSSADRRREMVRGDYEFVIINYDGLALVVDDILADGRFDLIVADECTAVKTATTKRWRALHRLIQPNTVLWMMTGTPAAQSPLDAYGLAKMVSPENVPRFYGAWRDVVMRQATTYKWVPKPNASKLVYNALQPAIRHTKEQCLDLPPVLTETRLVPLTPQQTKYYKLIKEKMVADAAGETISAVNAAASVNKLLQISAGAAYTDNHEVIEFDCSNRLRVLKEILDETERKVIVFAPYRHSIDTIAAYLDKEGYTHDAIHGDVSVTKRAAIVDKFQKDPDPRLLVLQPQAASHGITLTAADTVVYWSPVSSVELYKQGIARADRIGQTSKCVTVVHIEGAPVEKRLYDVLSRRIEDNNTFISMYKAVLQDDV